MDRNRILSEVRIIDALVEDRNTARREKDFASSDFIRKKLLALGVEINDSKDGGATWRFSEPQWNGSSFSNVPRKKVWDEIRRGWYWPEDMRDDISVEGLRKWQSEISVKIKGWIVAANENWKKEEKKKNRLFKQSMK